MSGLLLNPYRFEAPPVEGATTWNPADKTSSDMVLAMGDLQATVVVSGVTQNVRGTTFRDSGKVYYEGFIGLTAGFKFGLATVAWSLTDANSGGPGAVHYGHTGGIRSESAQLLAPWTHDPHGSATIRHAVDLDANLMWVAVNAGDWNGNPSADPETGVGGVTIPAGDYALSFSALVLNQYVILNAGATAFAYTPPTGFVGWEDA